MDLKIFAHESSGYLARDISRYIAKDTRFKNPLGVLNYKEFADGEMRPQFGENIRNKDIFIVQSTNPPAEKNIFRLCLMIDAAKRASADRVTAVIPYYGYGRQDRKDRPRVPISAEIVARLIQSAGADRILAMDLHATGIEGFFKIPVDHLYARPVLLKWVREHFPGQKFVLIAPDSGAVNRARGFAKRLDANIVVVDKERLIDNEATVNAVVGDVGPDDTALLADDMIDTGGTLIKVAQVLRDERGVRRVLAVATHGLFSGNAHVALDKSCIQQIVTTDTIQNTPQTSPPMLAQCFDNKFTTVSVAELFGEAITRIHTDEGSISELFE